MRTQHCFWDIPAKNAYPGSNHEEAPIMPKLSNILQNDYSVVINSQAYGGHKSQAEPSEGDQRNMTTE